MEDLPTDYDAIVVGTGLVESIYAAAAARIGKSVLHVDRNSHYSGEWAVLGLTGLLDWVARHPDSPGEEGAPPAEPGPDVRPLRPRRLVRGVTHRWHIPEGDVEPAEPPRRVLASVSGDDSALAEPAAVSDPTRAGGAGETVPDDADTVTEPDTVTESPETPGECPAAASDTAGAGTADPAPETPQPPAEGPEWTINRMKKLSRRFNIDLAPKVLYSRGALVELLISSSIARYAEFRPVGQLLTPLGGQLQPVPSSRADVFTNKHVSVVEKRLLMKLLTFCAEFEKHPEEYEGYEEKPFSEFLRARRLTDNLTHHVTHAIAMVTPQTPTLQALRCTQKFLRSLGRYGNTPFLWPMYGSGELPQCFCRLCAVFGGVYHLSRGLEALTVDDTGALSGVLSAGQRFTCRRLVLESAYGGEPEEEGEGGVSRAVLITDRSLYGPAGDQVLLMRLPAEEGQPGPVTVLQLGPASCAVPDGLLAVHLTCPAGGSAESDLSPAVARLQQLAASGDGGEPAPLRVLWELYFSRRPGGAGGQKLPPGVAVCSGPDGDVGFDAAVQEARTLFERHFPGEEFLPRAPDPEEIIFDDAEAESVVTGGAAPLAGEAEPAEGEDAGAADGGAAAARETPADGVEGS